MIHVIATIEAAAGQRAALLEAIEANLPNVRAENGCVRYEPTVDVETSIGAQGDVRDNVIVMIEQWESLDALEAHLVAPHMLEYRKKVKDLVAGVSLQVLGSP